MLYEYEFFCSYFACLLDILLLNQARVRTMNDLQSTLAEKGALQGEISMLEMKLAETDARIKAAAQEKIYAEVLEDQIEKLRNELLYRGNSERDQRGMHEGYESLFNQGNSPSNSDDIDALREELSNLKTENMALKNDLQTLTAEFNNIKETIERVPVLEQQRSDLQLALKELESKLSVSQADVSRLSAMNSEYTELLEKVENLQALLDKAAKQADQAVLQLPQNYELQRKVDRLEESLEEAHIYKLSAERFQQSTELVQQKMKLLEERIQKSDDEVHSYVQLYQESVKEFQETLSRLKEESQKIALNEPVDHMPQEFWSRLLLMIDGWLLENKISADDAKLLREMVWKKDRQIYDTYMACKNKNEHDAMGSFLRLISTPTRYLLREHFCKFYLWF